MGPLPSRKRHKGHNRHIIDNKTNIVTDVTDVTEGKAEDDYPEPGSFEPEDEWTAHRFRPGDVA